MTRRERQVLAALGQRLSNAEIASSLGVSLRTVEAHVSSLLARLGVSRRRELAAIFREVEEAERHATSDSPLLMAMPVGGPFVGRADALDTMRTAWSRACNGAPSVAVVSGDAGVGKSRLIAEFLQSELAAPARALVGLCDEDLPLPYQPFGELIAQDIESRPAAEVESLIAGRAYDLAALADGLTSRLPRRGTRAAASDHEHSRMHRAVSGYLADAARRGPMAIVLDDLQWARSSTVGLLRYVLSTLSGVPLLLVLSYRRADVEVNEPMRRLAT